MRIVMEPTRVLSERQLIKDLEKLRRSYTTIKKAIVRYFNKSSCNYRDCDNLTFENGLNFSGGDTFFKFLLWKEETVVGSGRLNIQSHGKSCYISRLFVRNSEDEIAII